MKQYLIIISLFISLHAIAVPARRDARIVKQQNGTTITLYAHGDECFSWFTNEKGQWLEQDANGNYQIVESKSVNEIQHLRRQSPYYNAVSRQTPKPINNPKRGLVVLVQFQDIKFQTEKATIDSMLNGENFTRDYTYDYEGQLIHVTSEGSARKFFEACSFGQYSPYFDVIGPLTASHNMSYYGADSQGRDTNASLLFKEICEQIASMNDIDLTLYNNDGDNKVDYVYFIYAGFGQADGGGTETIWAHASYLNSRYGYSIGKNGIIFDRYACNPEMNNYSKHYMGIGTFCHEFGHVMGLPDIYSTNSNTVHKTCGFWDVMDYGCYLNEGDNPPAYTGYERFFFGWATPRVLNEPEDVTLNPLITSNEVLLITANGTSNMIGNDPDPALFYVLDNRQCIGFDKYIPGHGMLITKINYSYNRWNSNNVNSNPDDLLVDIIEADNIASEYGDGTTGWFGKPGDAFPYGADEYKVIKDQPITNIKEDKDGIITFLYKGGAVTTTNEIINKTTEPNKIIENGNLYIIRNSQLYTLTGQKK